jgi:hypothetical protein
MRGLLLFLLLLFTSGYSKASSGDIKLAVASSVIILADWASTRDLARNYHSGFIEKGLVLSSIYGETPSRSQIDTYFAARLLVHYAAYKWLDNPYKNVYYTLTIVDHGTMLHNNLQLGLKIKF